MLIVCLKSVKHRTCAAKCKIIFISIALSVICVIMLHLFLPVTVQNSKCYTDTKNDALTPIHGKFVSPTKSIYFHETSCEGKLNSRQACAVESAATAHPKWQINLFFAGPMSKENWEKDLEPLIDYENIDVFRINIVEYVKGTPLDGMFKEGFSKSGFKATHLTDALRYLSLYKWGGVYLDLDMIVARSFDDLGKNWAAEQYENTIGTSALAVSRALIGRQFINQAIKDFRFNFNDWINKRADGVTRVLQKYCKYDKTTTMILQSCNGFHIYGPEMFYPVPWFDDYFDQQNLDLGDLKPYTYKIDANLTKNKKVVKGSAYARLAQIHCPQVYKYYGDKFGS